MTTLVLPAPTLAEGRFASIPVYTDEALFEKTGVRICFTTRCGGVSSGPYASLNLASHVEDNPEDVKKNRQILLDAFGFSDVPLIVPNQVHGNQVLTLSLNQDFDKTVKTAQEGADALILDSPQVAALLCFADCVPVIIVLPTGKTAVVHAGWRGVDNLISAKTFQMMIDQEKTKFAECQFSCEEDFADYLRQGANIYIGPFIHKEHFETSSEVYDTFVQKFGEGCAFNSYHIDLEKALRVQLQRAGANDSRIVSLDKCTVYHNKIFFSYRGQSGICGRHGAFAIRTY